MSGVNVCKRSVARAKKTLKGTTYVSMLACGCSERVARERAGGERGIHFASQNECRVHPSTKAASEAGAVSHTVAAERRPRKFKGMSANALASLRKRQKGSGEKRRAFPRMGACALGVRGGARLAAPVSPADLRKNTVRDSGTARGNAPAPILAANARIQHTPRTDAWYCFRPV